ncbi:hypothetical protein [Arundinibacter roseus]|uniref:CcmD family protein n=1 Tax=Arundinibacter roseus TaxID=2070510 RepID=A0A4R4KB42_9BACT|nr:hypothetical protein [Arundinibacter roseus]TDB63661.1 hypothetical protein EZE20_15290 [Arundinibacter roseus]
MKNILRKIVIIVLLLCINGSQLWAQCAMCRGSVESTMGNGRNNVGIGLNTGIMYLFVMPYLIVFAVGYLWYRNSRKAREEQRLIAARIRQVMNN